MDNKLMKVIIIVMAFAMLLSIVGGLVYIFIS